MTDLLHIISEFPTRHYAHLLPSLEKHNISTAEILTLDALEVAKRAHLPLLEVRRLKDHVTALLQHQLGLKSDLTNKFENQGEEIGAFGSLRKDGEQVTKPRERISTLDSSLDKALEGGVQVGYVTEITGESGAGKTQLLLSFLLSAQLPAPLGLNRAACYISTEHPLPTTRLHQILAANAILGSASTSAEDGRPSLSRILTLQTQDLESQEHILTYQLPVIIRRHNVGLVVIDSIAANFRAEGSLTSTYNAAALAVRSSQLQRLGFLLRKLAREHNIAVIVSNQVADRFDQPNPNSGFNAPSPTSVHFPHSTAPMLRHQLQQQQQQQQPKPQQQNTFSSSPAPSSSAPSTVASNAPRTGRTNDTGSYVLSLDFQQRFFTGWGDNPDAASSHGQNLKTPSLGLVWANQIACRIVLIKQAAYASATRTRPQSRVRLQTGQPAQQQQQQQQTQPQVADKTDINPTGGADTDENARPIVDEFDDAEFEDDVENATISADWTPRHWRRWMRVVFAPWVAGAREDDPGVEFEIWAGGLRHCS